MTGDARGWGPTLKSWAVHRERGRALHALGRGARPPEISDVPRRCYHRGHDTARSLRFRRSLEPSHMCVVQRGFRIAPVGCEDLLAPLQESAMALQATDAATGVRLRSGADGDGRHSLVERDRDRPGGIASGSWLSHPYQTVLRRTSSSTRTTWCFTSQRPHRAPLR